MNDGSVILIFQAMMLGLTGITILIVKYGSKKSKPTALSKALVVGDQEKNKQQASLALLLEDLDNHVEQIFENLKGWKDSVKHRAMDQLEERLDKSSLALWIRHYPDYYSLPKKHLLRFLRRVFAAHQSELLIPYAGNPEVREWFAEKKLAVPKAAMVGSLDIEVGEWGEISEV
jgi:hypothetical protein